MKCDECKYCDKTERICYYTGDNRCVENQKASKQNGWIPVSERLPEESGFYLVSVGAFSHPVRVYKWDNHQWKDEDFKVVEYAWFVKAWAKIPKPYESEGQI